MSLTSRVVGNDDANAGATLTSAELNVGTLGESHLGELESAVEAGSIALGNLLTLAGRDLLAHALEAGHLLSLL